MSDVTEALNTGGRRKRTHDAQIVVKLPAVAKELLRVAAQSQDVSDATIVRYALAEWFEKRGYRK
jgi:hypothetical protein